jgi:hypothetical protein
LPRSDRASLRLGFADEDLGPRSQALRGLSAYWRHDAFR